MYRISFLGAGNVAYRLSLALKVAGHTISYIYSRNSDSSDKLVYLLNKNEWNPHNISEKTKSAKEISELLTSDVIILAVSDDAIEEIADSISILGKNIHSHPVVLHTSGASSIQILNRNKNYGVFYPLMTLSKIKPVDFKIVPFFIEYSNDYVKEILISLVSSLGAEYRDTSSDERLKIHLAAVYVSNFINYLIGLSFDISKPNQTFLLPLAIETIRKAFLYEHPSKVQTGPAKRGDYDTIAKHLEQLKDMQEHKEVYQFLSTLIAKQK